MEQEGLLAPLPVPLDPRQPATHGRALWPSSHSVHLPAMMGSLCPCVWFRVSETVRMAWRWNYDPRASLLDPSMHGSIHLSGQGERYSGRAMSGGWLVRLPYYAPSPTLSMCDPMHMVLCILYGAWLGGKDGGVGWRVLRLMVLPLRSVASTLWSARLLLYN